MRIDEDCSTGRSGSPVRTPDIDEENAARAREVAPFAPLPLTLIAALFAAFAVLLFALAVPARAEVTPTVTSSYLLNGTNTAVANPASGRHLDFRQVMTPTYNPAGNGSGGDGEDLKRMVFDWPAGLLGDPNSVTSANRCGVDYTGVTATSGSPNYSACPASSIIGAIEVTLTATASVGECSMDMNGDLFLLRNRPTADPEVPSYIGIHIVGTPVGGFLGLCAAAGQQSMDMTVKIALRPTDLGLRLTVIDDMPRSHYTGALGGWANIKVLQVDQRAYGMAPAPARSPS